MEFLKDYKFGLNYHPRKANMVVDALSQKSLYPSWMMVENFRDLNLGVTLTPYSLRLD